MAYRSVYCILMFYNYLGVKVYNRFVITTSVDQKIIFSSWSYDLSSKTIQVSPFASYFTTVADIHGLIAHKYE